MSRSLERITRYLQIAAVAVIAACLALGVGSWLLLSHLDRQWRELVDATDDGLERVEGVLAASTELAAETGDGLDSVDGVVDSGGALGDQTVEVVTSVQDVMLPLIDNVDSFAASLEEMARFIERNDALGLLGVELTLDSAELAQLRADLAVLEEDLAGMDADQTLLGEVDSVSSSLDSVVLELRSTERELSRSAERVAVARQDLDAMRDDLTPVLWLARGLILAFLTTLALSQFGLYALCRALRDGTVPPAVESESAVRPVLALSGRRSAESA